MAVSEAQKRADKKWKDANYERATIYMPKGTKERIQNQSIYSNTLNGFINEAVKQLLEQAEI